MQTSPASSPAASAASTLASLLEHHAPPLQPQSPKPAAAMWRWACAGFSSFAAVVRHVWAPTALLAAVSCAVVAAVRFAYAAVACAPPGCGFNFADSAADDEGTVVGRPYQQDSVVFGMLLFQYSRLAIGILIFIKSTLWLLASVGSLPAMAAAQAAVWLLARPAVGPAVMVATAVPVYIPVAAMRYVDRRGSDLPPGPRGALKAAHEAVSLIVFTTLV
ncbi:hypothetical protein HK405_005702, partial [Cladochytrium tenue]